jgi:hypothetical protein
MALISQRRALVRQLEACGFSIVVEPESFLSAFRLRVSHPTESAITLFLLSAPSAVQSVEPYPCG